MPALAPPDPPLTDGSVTLRAWRDSDVPALVQACRDPDVLAWTRVPSPYRESDARAFMAIKRDRQAAGAEVYFAAVDRADTELLGSFSLRLPGNGIGDVGYWVAAPARRRRVATRAVGLIARWAFATLGLERLQLVADVDNLPSQGVAERSGFTREGMLRSYLDIGRGRSDAVMFSRLPADPRSSP